MNTSHEQDTLQRHLRARRTALRAAMAVAGLLTAGCGVSVEAMQQQGAQDVPVVADASSEAAVPNRCDECLPLLGDDPNQAVGCNAAYVQCLRQMRVAGVECELGCQAWGPFVPVEMEG